MSGSSGTGSARRGLEPPGDRAPEERGDPELLLAGEVPAEEGCAPPPEDHDGPLAQRSDRPALLRKPRRPQDADLENVLGGDPGPPSKRREPAYGLDSLEARLHVPGGKTRGHQAHRDG